MPTLPMEGVDNGHSCLNANKGDEIDSSNMHQNMDEGLNEKDRQSKSDENEERNNKEAREGENCSLDYKEKCDSDPFVVNSSEDDSEDEKNKEITDDGWEDILGSGRLKKRVLKEGKKGRASEGLGRPSRNDHVTIGVKGYFQDVLFEEQSSLKFFAAEAEVVQAIDLCVVLMNTGEIAEVMTDPEMAYGAIGLPPHVPPKAAVRFEIELISHSAPVSPSELSVAQKSEIGFRKRERGNFWFSRQDYTAAIQCYRKAGEFFDDEKLELEVPIDRYELPQELQDLLDDRLKAYNNLAMAQMKIEAWDSALAALQQVLRIEPNNEKALYRKSKALVEKYRMDEAIGILRRVSRLYPNNSMAKADLSRLTANRKKGREVEEKISKKMLGLDRYEAEKAKERWYKKYVREGWFSTSIIISVTGVIFAAAGSAYYSQFHL